MKRSEIFVCLPNFSGGGAEKVMTLVAHLLSSKLANVPNKILSEQNSSTIAPATPSQKQTCKNQKLSLSHVTKSDFVVTCVVLDDEGPLKSAILERCNIVNLKVPSARSAIASLVKLFRQRKPQIVISTLAYFNFVIVMALLLSRHVPKRTIVREANVPSSTIETFLLRYIGQLLYRWLYNRADIVICNSRETNDQLVALGVEKSRLVLIPNPVDVDFVRKQALKSVNLPIFLDPSLTLFISVGRLTKQKGMDRLINWVASMGARANLLIMGQGPERGKLEFLIESNGLTGRAKIIDFQDNPFPYMSNADAILLGSRWEGLPNVALEAMAIGKQVVATTQCGGLLDIKHLLDDQALVIAGTDEEYVEILDRLADQHQSTRNAKKTIYRKTQLAAPTLPISYTLEFVIEKYEAAIFGR